ncbi:MAG TPA: DinB family protein [Thermoanaerobaculia bacterium]|nr:DinB family protein [Thermoanaerobaculia bacterium]
MFDHLRAFPQQLRELIARVPPERLRMRLADGTFAAVEQAWHLADLEVEGYGERIRRIEAEDEPELADFRGDVVAAERKYLELELEPALVRFEEARARNVAALESARDRSRAGHQEGVGRVTLARIAEMMAEHDAGHAAELHALLQER